MENREAKMQVIKAGKELSQTGLIARTWGNVSCRLGDEYFAITASGKSYLTLTEDEVIEVKIEDLSYEGDIKPSSEKKIHREIYRLKDDAGFVIHTHQENASAVGAMPIDSAIFDKYYEGIGDRVVCAKYALPGTKALCKNTVEAVKKSEGNAVILKNHGALCYGRDYNEAFATAHNLEDACGEFLKKYCPAIASDRGACKDAVLRGKNNLWNKDDLVVKFSRLDKDLKPFLDDFAQMIGIKARVVRNKKEMQKVGKTAQAVIVPGRGALCTGKTMSDAEAVSMLVSKNCKAFFAASSFGVARPINHFEAALMRTIYLRKYSKLGE